MADVIKKATNKFTKGLVMDFSPENTQNEVLTHALNATLLTFNGNELSLQNDMGNARVETAYLPEGYMPVGTCEYGGIIYIVSYNPLEDKSLIGCFPSPERNISNEEIGISDAKIAKDSFQEYHRSSTGLPTDPTGTISNTTLYVLLKQDSLNPGDKFLICSDKTIYDELLADLLVDKHDSNGFNLKSHPVIALNVVSIEDSGKIIYLNSDVKQYKVDNVFKDSTGLERTYTYKYHILGEMAQSGGVYDQSTVDPDAYRNVLNSGYSVFKSKTSGKLAILVELLMIDSYSVTHSIQPKKDDDNNIIDGAFDIIIHSDISPAVTSDNYNIVPKLKYYFLENSLGYLQTFNLDGIEVRKPLYNVVEGQVQQTLNLEFFNTLLSDLYVPTTNEDLKLNYTLKKTSQFNFPKPGTYHGRLDPYLNTVNGTINSAVITKFTEGKYYRIKKSQIINYYQNYYIDSVQAKFYKYVTSEKLYQKWTEEVVDASYTYYIKSKKYTYYDVNRDKSHRNKTLYKLETIPSVADETKIKDTEIEKFLYITVNVYRLATPEEISQGTNLYIKTGLNEYTEFKTTPEPDGIYYFMIVTRELKSMGKVPTLEMYKDTVYYYPTTKEYIEATQKEVDDYYDTIKYPSNPPYKLYWRDEKDDYIPATEDQVLNFKDWDIELWYDTNYVSVDNMTLYDDSHGQLFITVPIDTYVPYSIFEPNEDYNYIEGGRVPESLYPKDDKLCLYTLSDFIPSDLENSDFISYDDFRLASIKLPGVVSLKGLDLPFKYDYTLTPCMNYGRLDHLKVSNTVDFGNLRAFNQSNFTTWKYRIDGNLLRLTFGADIFDTYETNKVDALVIEFYDAWGFAGSIEITDKKSYSGIFTKIIYLDTYKALSTKRVGVTNYYNNYKRNINIIEKVENETSSFTLNNKPVLWLNPYDGWTYTNTDTLPEEDNDCGTLYSNILYGVKTYLRRTDELGVHLFIPKDNFFLYTIPIYNDYYYSVNNFNSLLNPEILLMMTYKLQDKGTKLPYNQVNAEDDTKKDINDGYVTTDKDNISNYLSGFYAEDSLDIVRYYLYLGITDLYLEIGLKKDYELFNMYFDPKINELYRCNIRLISDEDPNSTFTVYSGTDELIDPVQILNYNNKNNIQLDYKSLNKIGITSEYNNQYSPNSFITNNFINNTGNNPILINYEFVVGYKAEISNIRTTQVPATTVCALCHKRPDESYNYEDFGIYESNNEYLSSKMFYNGGTSEMEICGLATQRTMENSSGNNTSIENEINSITQVTTPATRIVAAGRLNTDALKTLVPLLGKLTFCLPHAHAINSLNGVNIEWDNENTGLYIRDPHNGSTRLAEEKNKAERKLRPGTDDDSQGWLLKYPKYNLSLNTLSAIQHKSEFISTLEYVKIESSRLADGECRKYTGYTYDQIKKFNKALITTMKSVYAYNPDYDSLEVNVGNAALQQYNPYFTSNLINTFSYLDYEDGLSLNDFIYLGSVLFTKYLLNLTKYSIGMNEKVKEIATDVPQVLLMADFTYCGSETNPYLISTLTYNTPVPQELEKEIEFSSFDNIVVKQSDGTNVHLKGSPNKKSLYHYSSDFNKLIELDVSNYKIDLESGELTLKDSSFSETCNIVLKDLLDSSTLYKSWIEPASIEVEFNSPILNTLFKICPYLKSDYKLKANANDGYFYFYSERGLLKKGISWECLPIMYTENGYTYKAKQVAVTFVCDSVLLSKTATKYANIDIKNLTTTELNCLFTLNSSETVKSVPVRNLLAYPESSAKNATEYGMFSYSTPHGLSKDSNNESGIPSSKAFFYINGSGNDLIELYRFKITQINLVIERSTSLANNPSNVISTTRTEEYSRKNGHRYEVLSTYTDSLLAGSSLTINDLIYDPNKDGHRLFIRDGLCSYDNINTGKIYYRTMNWENNLAIHESWSVDTEYFNSLFIFTGPCFTSIK